MRSEQDQRGVCDLAFSVQGLAIAEQLLLGYISNLLVAALLHPHAPERLNGIGIEICPARALADFRREISPRFLVYLLPYGFGHRNEAVAVTPPCHTIDLNWQANRPRRDDKDQYPLFGTIIEDLKSTLMRRLSMSPLRVRSG